MSTYRDHLWQPGFSVTRPAWVGRLRPATLATVAWLILLSGPLLLSSFLRLARRVGGVVGEGIHPVLGWLMNWSSLVIALPLVGLTLSAGVLGGLAARRSPHAFVKAAGIGAALLSGLVAAWLVFLTVVQLRYDMSAG